MEISLLLVIVLKGSPTEDPFRSLVATKLIPGLVMAGADGDAVSMHPEDKDRADKSRRIHAIPTHTYGPTSEFLGEVVVFPDIW